MKPGVKTTEFWLSLLAMVLVNLPQIFTDAQWALVAGLVGTALIAMGYGYVRTRAKAEIQGGTTVLNATLPPIEDILKARKAFDEELAGEEDEAAGA